MKSLTRTDAAEFLMAHDRYAILTHTRPDGDTVGSSAALCLGLRALGKNAHILYNEEVSPRFQWLHEGLTKPEALPGDTLVSVDVAAPNMLPKAFERYLGSISLRMDHHGTASSFTEYELVDPDSASCAELILDVLRIMRCPENPQIMDAVYTGASTDTGCFRFSNTTAHTFETAAACALGGARIYELNQTLFETNTLAKLRMQAWMIDHLHLSSTGKTALCAIPLSVEKELGVTKDDMDNISNFPRTVEGVCMAATLRETEDGCTKLSIRAIPGWDAAAVCAQFGGGGHKGAAGAVISMPLTEASAAVSAAMPEHPV